MERIGRRAFVRTGLATAGTVALATGCIPSAENQTPRFRTKNEALISYRLRSFLHGRRLPDSPLEKILNTSLADSRQIGLANSHLFEEEENSDLGNLTFSIKPWNPFVNINSQKIPLLANTPAFTSFRPDKEAIVRVFDRAVWAANNGRNVTAIIETDKATKENLNFTVKMLLDLGIRSFRIGNETNNPDTPWLADPKKIYEFAVQVRELTEEMGIKVDISTPPLAYYGHGEYFRELIRYCHAASNGSRLPFTRYSFNVYGPDYDLLPTIKRTDNIARQEGIIDAKLDISEAGNPYQAGEVSDRELAEGYIPKALSTIISSGLIEHVGYYSLYSGDNEDHSLVTRQGNRLTPKESFRSYSVMTKLLAKLRLIDFDQRDQYTRIIGNREDGISFYIIWANGTSFTHQLNPNDLVFTPLGKRVNHSGVIRIEDPVKIVLPAAA